MTRRKIILTMAMIMCIGALMISPAVAVQGFAKQAPESEHSPLKALNEQKLHNMGESEQIRNQNAHSMGVAACIQQCPDDVWDIISTHKLSIFDLRVDTATALIALYEEKGFDVTDARVILDEIKDMREDLSAALESRDKDELKTVYEDISSLWKDLRKEFRQWLKNPASPEADSLE